VWIFERSALRHGNPDKAQHFDRLVPSLLVGHRPMQADRLVIWSPIRITGLSEVIGS